MEITSDSLLPFYESHLRNHVLPFWMPLVDTKHGGLLNCVENDGTIVSFDKYLWSQCRVLWTFSALYHHIEKNPHWLEIADRTADFLMTHGRCSDGAWAFILERDGTLKEPPRSIYVDAFAIYGLTEYAKVSGNTNALDLAIETYWRTSPRLDDHSQLDTVPHPIPDGLQTHGVWMIFALVYHDLGMVADDAEIRARALELAERVMTQHVKPADKLLYEFTRPGGDLDDSDAGKSFIPGHAIESMWFMERIYRHHRRTDRIDLAMDVIHWNLEKGWDEEYGGLYLGCHRDGGTPAWHQPDAKVWWPHTEALYALLVAWYHTGEQWCAEWYERVHDYTFRHFPNEEHGDWYHYLNRKNQPIGVVLKGLVVKDPFHLPRTLIYVIDLLRRKQ